MFTASTFLISTDDLTSILVSWVIAAGLITTLAVLNRRRIQANDRHV